MDILHLTGTFGRLDHSELSLSPGLNVLYAPNETGKSTWGAFIRTMLYGLSTRERGPLADKNRYAPWTGAPMQGRMDLTTHGDACTLLRETRRAASPLGEFSCTYTGTGTPVPGITGQNAGEVLLGVPREVFERSAFIGQNALAVDQDAELERRIAALITTGEEDTSYTESYDRLKKQLNRRKHNKTGLIPALEREADQLRAALAELVDSLKRLEAENEGVIKAGRTHLQDATPISFPQEISGWRSSLERDAELIRLALPPLRELALGGTAVGTGLNAPAGFAEEVAAEISRLTGKDFRSAPNKFHALTSRDELVFAHGALQALAGDLMKLANDIRWLGSGPRNGLGELFLPENEPGSSIMPGKVNPTQCEALTMIAVQVMANGAGIGFAASQGNFELNVFLPVLAHEFLQSARLLAEGMRSFRLRCADGIRANREKMAENLRRSLMLVTALSPTIGYEAAAETAKLAHREDLTLREACLRLGCLTGEQFDALFHPEEMV